MSKKLKNARGLYLEGIRDGKVRESIEKYTGDRYTQHSTGVADGVEGFVAFFESFIERVPDRDIQIVRAIEDGPYVFLQVSQDLNKGEARWVTTDLFDTDADDQIIEHWDVISEWVADDQFDGPTEVADIERTETNKSVVEGFVREALIQGSSAADECLDEDLRQHECGVADGSSAWRTHLDNPDRPTRYQELFRLIGQGNFVVTYCKVLVADELHAVFDLFRLADNRIVERWTNAEIVSEDTGNSGKV